MELLTGGELFDRIVAKGHFVSAAVAFELNNSLSYACLIFMVLLVVDLPGRAFTLVCLVAQATTVNARLPMPSVSVLRLWHTCMK